MSELIINISGTESYTLELSIYESVEEDSVEVWQAVFTEVEHKDSHVVYFEMDSDEYVEVWDVVNMAIEAYRGSIGDED